MNLLPLNLALPASGGGAEPTKATETLAEAFDLDALVPPTLEAGAADDDLEATPDGPTAQALMLDLIAALLPAKLHTPAPVATAVTFAIGQADAPEVTLSPPDSKSSGPDRAVADLPTVVLGGAPVLTLVAGHVVPKAVPRELPIVHDLPLVAGEVVQEAVPRELPTVPDLTVSSPTKLATAARQVALRLPSTDAREVRELTVSSPIELAAAVRQVALRLPATDARAVRELVASAPAPVLEAVHRLVTAAEGAVDQVLASVKQWATDLRAPEPVSVRAAAPSQVLPNPHLSSSSFDVPPAGVGQTPEQIVAGSRATRQGRRPESVPGPARPHDPPKYKIVIGVDGVFGEKRVNGKVEVAWPKAQPMTDPLPTERLMATLQATKVLLESPAQPETVAILVGNLTIREANQSDTETITLQNDPETTTRVSASAGVVASSLSTERPGRIRSDLAPKTSGGPKISVPIETTSPSTSPAPVPKDESAPAKVALGSPLRADSVGQTAQAPVVGPTTATEPCATPPPAVTADKTAGAALAEVPGHQKPPLRRSTSTEVITDPVQKLASGKQTTKAEPVSPSLRPEFDTKPPDAPRTPLSEDEEPLPLMPTGSTGQPALVTEAKQAETVERVKSVGRQVADQVRDLIQARRPGKVTVILEPRELGTVTVTVRHEGNRFSADVQASDPVLLQQLADNKVELVKAAEGRGMTMDSFNVGTQAQGQGHNPQGQATRQDFERRHNLHDHPTQPEPKSAPNRPTTSLGLDMTA